MGKFSPIASVPRYMREFKCVGPACPQTCCSGWNVDIDKATYQKYRTIKIEPLGSLLRAHVVKREGQAAARSFAGIAMKADGDCPFLSEKLCQIQGALGSEALSDTCAEYPRYHAIRKGAFYSLYGTLSCPEAARLALADPEAMSVSPMTLPFANPQQVPLQVIRHPQADTRDAFSAQAELIRAACESLVHQPLFSASDALIITGLITRSCAGISREAQSIAEGCEMIERKLATLLEPSMLSELKSQIDGVSAPVSFKMMLMRDATARYMTLFDAGRPSLFRDQVALSLQGLDYKDNDEQGVSERFFAAQRDWFEPFDAAHPHLLKNYLLNDFGKRLFPLGTHDEVEDELMRLGIRFSLIKMYLVGIAAAKREAFGAEDYIKTVYTLTRAMEHNDRYMTNALSVLTENGLNNLASLALFAK